MGNKSGKPFILVMLTIAFMLLSFCACGKTSLEGPAPAEAAEEPISEEIPEPDRYEGLPRLENAFVSARYPLYEGSEHVHMDLICIGNRPYVYADYSGELGELSWPLYEDENGVYMSLVDFVNFNNLTVEFKASDETVHYYFLEEYPWSEDAKAFKEAAEANPDTQPAYIRIEDVMADNGASGRYSDYNLTRTRVMADYISAYSRAFYIAWIPLYVNPGENIVNNVATDYSFYNADFVFTLDYMQLRGGKLGLHGLTHQYGDSVSADGIEFGGRGSRGHDELFEIFDQAAEICHALGYEYYFFEFPHYDATEFEKKVAEEYFDIVFEHYMSKKDGVIERHELDGHTCLWVPTPADYVYNQYDVDGILGRLESSRRNGYILSLFFHPAMDIERFAYTTDGCNRTFIYDGSGEYAILGGIMNYLGEHGYIFDEIR